MGKCSEIERGIW